MSDDPRRESHRERRLAEIEAELKIIEKELFWQWPCKPHSEKEVPTLPWAPPLPN